MELRWQAVDFKTGYMHARELPLEDARVSSAIDQPGQFSARVDLRRMVKDERDFAGARDVQAMLQVAASSVILVRDGLANGTMNDLFSQVVGEWWITGVEREHRSPWLTLRGVEFGGYLAHATPTVSWKIKAGDPLYYARQLLLQAMRTDQDIAGTVIGDANCGVTEPIDIPEGTASYADHLRDLQGDGLWEWCMSYALDTDGAKTRLMRTAEFAAPRMWRSQLGRVFEVATPGDHPGTAEDVSTSLEVGQLTYKLTGWGAGSGRSQLKSVQTRTRPASMPVLSRTVTAQDVTTAAQLKRETGRALRAMDPARQPFTILAQTRFTPAPMLGGVHHYIRNPSLSMPDPAEQMQIRILGWEWAQPRSGEMDLTTLTVERVG